MASGNRRNPDSILSQVKWPRAFAAEIAGKNGPTECREIIELSWIIERYLFQLCFAGPVQVRHRFRTEQGQHYITGCSEESSEDAIKKEMPSPNLKAATEINAYLEPIYVLIHNADAAMSRKGGETGPIKLTADKLESVLGPDGKPDSSGRRFLRERRYKPGVYLADCNEANKDVAAHGSDPVITEEIIGEKFTF
ncbi:hypothetical protein C8R44DRAFT_725695 [Mycena epipterygia]|nr:hypothetical protein C8R44DRAFT_725695 [Mycena epipterygia]